MYCWQVINKVVWWKRTFYDFRALQSIRGRRKIMQSNGVPRRISGARWSGRSYKCNLMLIQIMSLYMQCPYIYLVLNSSKTCFLAEFLLRFTQLIYSWNSLGLIWKTWGHIQKFSSNVDTASCTYVDLILRGWTYHVTCTAAVVDLEHFEWI